MSVMMDNDSQSKLPRRIAGSRQRNGLKILNLWIRTPIRTYKGKYFAWSGVEAWGGISNLAKDDDVTHVVSRAVVRVEELGFGRHKDNRFQ